MTEQKAAEIQNLTEQARLAEEVTAAFDEALKTRLPRLTAETRADVVSLAAWLLMRPGSPLDPAVGRRDS